MNEKSPMEIQYEEWLAREDRMVEKDGQTFYRIIRKDRLSLKDGTVVIVVPWDLLKNTTGEYSDENGNVFRLGSPMHMSFRCAIPTWYLETASVPVEGIHETTQIGNYLSKLNRMSK